MTSRPNVHGVASAIDAAELFEPSVPAPQRDREQKHFECPDMPPGEANAQGVDPGQWDPNWLGLPDDCPVKPLGYNDGVFFFLDTKGQLRALKDKDFGQKALDGLFMGRDWWLQWAWPRYNAKEKVVGYRAEKVGPALMGACARKGPWTAVERIRGRGAWLGTKGQLVLHCGTEIWIDGRSLATGEYGRHVYPQRPPVPSPWPTRIDDEGNPAKLLMPLFRRWNWARPDVDPILLLGWVGAAFVGGALAHRPCVYITGDKGTGKSTLQETLKHLFGEALIQTTNTTAAGIYQQIREDSLPIAVDEFEAKDNNGRAKAILELARQAYSGGLLFRGGDSHIGVQIQSRSSFLFSSINAPPLEPQDLSRMALLRLRRINRDEPPPVIDADDLAKLGSMVMRRIMDNWHRYNATFEAYRAELREGGHDGRGCDTFGTLLTMADLIIGESFDADQIRVPMGEDLTIWRERLKIEDMAEYEDAVENWRLCLSHLLTAAVDAWRGGMKLTIGRVIQDFYDKVEGTTYNDTRDRLEQAGVTILKPDELGGCYWLAIPNQNPMLHKLFQGTKWGGEPGAGVWAAALRQGPRGTLWETKQARVSGDKGRCTCISLDALYGPGGLMVDEKTKQYS